MLGIERAFLSRKQNKKTKIINFIFMKIIQPWSLSSLGPKCLRHMNPPAYRYMGWNWKETQFSIFSDLFL